LCVDTRRVPPYIRCRAGRASLLRFRLRSQACAEGVAAGQLFGCVAEHLLAYLNVLLGDNWTPPHLPCGSSKIFFTSPFYWNRSCWTSGLTSSRMRVQHLLVRRSAVAEQERQHSLVNFTRIMRAWRLFVARAGCALAASWRCRSVTCGGGGMAFCPQFSSCGSVSRTLIAGNDRQRRPNGRVARYSVFGDSTGGDEPLNTAAQAATM